MSNELADAVFEAIGHVTDPLFARILALESEIKMLRERPGVPGPVGPQGAEGGVGKDGADGKDGQPFTVEQLSVAVAKNEHGLRSAIDAMLHDATVEHLTANPPAAGRDGHDGAKGADGRDGSDGRDGADAPAPTIEQVKAAILEMPDALTVSLEKYFAAHPVADGKDGAVGPAGEKGESMTAEKLMTALALNEHGLRGEFEQVLTKAATGYLQAFPPPAGQNGAPGADGRDGKDGKDGVGLAGAMQSKDGTLVLTMTNGEVRDVGLVQGKDGAPGAPGQDGLGFDDLKAEQIDDQTIELKATKGDQVKVLGRFVMPVHVYEGVYEPGQTYRKGKSVTWDGSLWIAKEETAVTPGTGSAWQLAVKRGREGKPGKGVVGPQGPQGEKGDRGIDRWS